MELNVNSLSARVYREVYNTRHMPESLCPYFWKLVLAYPLILILLPLLIPTWIMMKYQKEVFDPDTDFQIGAKAIMGLFIYGFGLMVFSIGVFISSYWVTYYSKTVMHSFYIGGGFVMIILGVGCFYLLVRYFIKKHKFKRIFNNEYTEERPNLVIEFVKAKYKRYCPKITWK